MDTDVQFLRLKTGEDLITEVQETEDTLILLNPCKVMYLKGTGTSYLSISLMQWIFTKICSEQVFEIDKNEVLVKTFPDEGLIEHYWNSIEYFESVDSKKEISYESESFEAESELEETSTEEGLELIKELLKTKIDKGKLH